MQTNRVIGSLLGAAAGNCAGTPYIFMKARDLRPKARDLGWQIAGPGIDFELAMACLRTISRSGINFDRIARQYSRTIRSAEAEPDIVSTRCFAEKCDEAATVRARAEEAEFGTICSNALLIRQLPIVYAGLCWDVSTLKEHIREEASLTHSDEETIECAQLFALVLHSILNGKNRLEIWDMLFSEVRHTGIHTLIVRSYYEKPRCDASNYNDIRIAFQLSLYHFWHQTPFTSAIRDAILSGGATDINASATGALLGASQGIHSIPSAWRADLDPAADEPRSSWRRRLHTAVRQVQRLTKHTAILAPSRLTLRNPPPRHKHALYQ